MVVNKPDFNVEKSKYNFRIPCKTRHTVERVDNPAVKNSDRR